MGLGLGAILVLVVLGFVVWAVTGTRHAGQMASAALQSSPLVEVKQDEWIVFEPASSTDTGIIFYPGGLVEAAAYAPILEKIAEDGVLVVITPMPLNLAILNTNAADAVISAYPTISHWMIAGHSLGGAAAAIYADTHREQIEAIAFWDSYPPEANDLSDSSLQAISIFGTTNGVPNPDNFDAQRHLLPASTLFVGIEGANHAQFGDYGPQQGDVEASLTPQEQYSQVAEIMIDFIDSLR